ncbi:glycoside hydrolase family 3 N-terminal domain-containing protein [Balneolales bacterium ANBcel1]|nr:glycoside hydrolase family 3 N-terminal domain-containing protein [Balneolales bacterium ANBcel1]
MQNNRRSARSLFLFLLLPFIISATSGDVDYRDASLPPEVRTEALLELMTLEEKVAQVQTIWAQRERMADANGDFHPDSFDVHFPHSVGQLARPSENPFAHTRPHLGVRETVEWINDVQRHAMENTRLGIPILMHEESLHGLMAIDATSFPQAIALAGTWDRELVEEVYRIAASEIRARGANLALTPVLDVARDARWGRVEETYGEDPYLAAEMGLAAVFGFQGREERIPDDRVASVVKHFAAHGQPESGINAGPINISKRELREIHMEPFRVAIQKGRVRGVMPAYHEIDGVPTHGDIHLMQNILRDEWGFEGVTVADYGAIMQMHTMHRVANDREEAALMAMKAGVDSEMPDRQTYHLLTGLVKDGRLDESLIDRSVRRILHLKFELGLFEDPYADVDKALEITGHPDHIAFAREVAEQSMVLLQNRNDLAPLSVSDYPTIAVIGPNAADTLLGSYSGVPKTYYTVLDGITSYVGDHANVVYAQGPIITKPGHREDNEVFPPDPENDRKRLAEAISVAEKADLVILAIGGNELTGREAWAAHHPGDRPDLTLLGLQEDLVDAVGEMGVPSVALIFGARPLDLGNVAEKIDVVFQNWYLGQETGHAVANVLFGEVSPSAKLPISFPRTAGHIPAYYNYKPSARRVYLFDDVTPRYHFGYGLSYTTFEYGKPVLSDTLLADGGEVTLTIDVTNTGERSGAEIVQLYINQQYRSVTRPVKELRGFDKVYLEPGETAEVSFTITPEMFKFWNIDMEFTTEPGMVNVMVGSSSRNEDLQVTEMYLQ